MKIKFLGAAGTVTGSSYVLTSESGQSILIDLGMFQGVEEIERLNYRPFDYDCSQLSGALLTHAHLDHCGRLPILLSHGFTKDIWMTPATRDLTELSLYDSAKIAKKDKKKILYDKDLVEETMNHVRVTGYKNPITIGDFTFVFRDAGHLLGAGSIEIEDASSTSAVKKIVFSGDLGNTPQGILFPTDYIESADAVVMESTYGDRLHPDLDPIEILLSEILTVEKSGGALLIPAFSLEKTQELLHMIMHLKQAGKVQDDTPVFLDSPMAQKATAIHLRYPEYMNPHINTDLETADPFEFPGLEVPLTHQDSLAIHDLPGAKIIIAGGGMMTGGRILNHASHYLPDAINRLLIVGYQGEDTLGREILEGSKRVYINDMTVDIKATVSSTQAMSSHADQSQLLDWLGRIKGVRKVFLTHGDPTPRSVLAQKIHKDLGITDIVLPLQNQEVAF